MKNHLHLSCCLFALFVCILPAQAQVGTETQRYQQAAGDRSVLFRGEQAAAYSFLANGNPYWEDAAFRRGNIVFEGNLYQDVLLNIDAHAQRVLVHLSSGPFSVSLSPALTPSFTMDGRRFAGFGPGEALPEGFYEIFGEGPERIYKRVDKPLNSNFSNANGDLIGYYDEHYRADVYRHFALVRTYYFRDADGQFSRIKGKGALLRKFPERKKELRRAINKAGLGPKEFDECCELVLNLTSR